MQRKSDLHSEHWTSISDFACPNLSPWHDWGRSNCSEIKQRTPPGNAHLPRAERLLSAPVGERDTSQRGSSVASTIDGQNSAPSCSLNNSGVADITNHMTSTPSATQRWSINTLTATLGTSSCGTPAPGGTSPADSTHRVVSNLASRIASSPNPLTGLENLPTPIPNLESRAIITIPLQTWASEGNQRLRQWQLQSQVVSTPPSMVSRSRSIHRFGHSDMTRLVFSTGRYFELYMLNRRLLMSARDLEMASYATQRVVKAFAEAPHWQIIEKYWNTAIQGNNIWSIACEAPTNEILKEVCWSKGPQWILNAQTGTRFEHKSAKLNSILFNPQGKI